MKVRNAEGCGRSDQSQSGTAGSLEPPGGRASKKRVYPDARIAAPEEVYQDIMSFIDAVAELPFETKSIGISIAKEQILDIYRNIYYMKE